MSVNRKSLSFSPGSDSLGCPGSRRVRSRTRERSCRGQAVVVRRQFRRLPLRPLRRSHNEKLRVRIRRHLSNQRTDAVAMNVLDPFEVAEIEMWPLCELTGVSASESKPLLASAEFSIFRMLLEESLFGAVLNEKLMAPAPLMMLPDSVRGRIVPAELYERRSHPDIRIARRASTIAKLTQGISERSVQSGLRRTLLTQARRLEHLARQRLEQVPEDA